MAESLLSQESVSQRKWIGGVKYAISAVCGALALYAIFFAMGQAPGITAPASASSSSAHPTAFDSVIHPTHKDVGSSETVETTTTATSTEVKATSTAKSTWPLCNMSGVWTQDSNRCECYQCITGTNCTTFTPEPNCRISATSGQPYLMQEWWNTYTNGEPPTSYYGTPVNWRGPYQNTARLNAASATDPSLDNQLNLAIRNLHAKYNNIVLGASDPIIITTGATQFWSACMWAIAKRAADTGSATLPLYVFERVPYYFGHPNMVTGGTNGEMLNFNMVQWSTNTTLDASRVIEVLTQPSNPLGDFYDPVYTAGNKRIYDLVYYWPHLAPVTKPFNETVMFFSLTKLSGHAATRFGWAVVKDTNLATQINSFINANTMGPSVDIKWRALNIIKDVTQTTYTDYVSNTMKDRWVRIMDWFNSGQTRFELLSTPGTAYIYTLCLRDANCGTVFTNAGIDGFTGARFGDTRNVYRINLTLHNYAFDLLMQKLWKLTPSATQDPTPETVQKWISELPPPPNFDNVKFMTEDIASQIA